MADRRAATLGCTGGRRWVAGLAGSVGAHAAIVVAVSAVVALRPTPPMSSAPPAVAIELAPEPSAPPKPPNEAPPEPERKPVVEPPKPDMQDLPRMPQIPDAVTLPPRKVTPPPPPPEQTPSPPSPPAAPPKPFAAAPVTGTPTSGTTTAEQDWDARVLARIQQKKRYPADAMRNGLEDIVYVRIMIDRRGTVLDSEIVRSKQIAVLDAAVKDIVRRSSPLPPLPDVIGGDRYSIVVPVDFFLSKSR